MSPCCRCEQHGCSLTAAAHAPARSGAGPAHRQPHARTAAAAAGDLGAEQRGRLAAFGRRGGLRAHEGDDSVGAVAAQPAAPVARVALRAGRVSLRISSSLIRITSYPLLLFINQSSHQQTPALPYTTLKPPRKLQLL